MKAKKLFVFSIVLFLTSAVQAKTFRCSSLKTEHDVLRLLFNSSNDLISIAQIAQLPFSAEDIESPYESVKSKVTKDASDNQTVEFSMLYTKRITLKINLSQRTASIEVFDTDDWKVTSTQELKCDFDGYYESRK